MRMSRERIFHLADLILKELGQAEGVQVKAPDDVRPELIRVITEESKLEESIDSFEASAPPRVISTDTSDPVPPSTRRTPARL